jgi:hypothetical protein
MRDDRSLQEVVLADGRSLIALTGIALALAEDLQFSNQSPDSYFRKIAMQSGWTRVLQSTNLAPRRICACGTRVDGY